MADRSPADVVVDHVVRDRVTPLAAPLILEVGRVAIAGEGREELMMRETATLMEASGLNKIEVPTSKPQRRVGE